MSNKTYGIILIVVGVVFVIVAILAHSLGLSSSNAMGLKKILLLAVGVVALVAGLVMAFFMKPKKS
jgi:Na+/H+-dicarboxylate symporter